MGVEPPSCFCSNNELFAARFAHLCDQLLGMPIAIDVSGIDEVDTQINGPVEGCQGGFVIGGTPGTKTNGRDVPAGATEGSIFHIASLLSSANAALSVAHSGLSRISGLCTRGKDGFPRSGGVAGGTIGMIGTEDSVEMEHASTSRAETGGVGESLAGS